ncbi:MAG: acyl-CoA dehydrogenase family protein [Solirubrobacterales bacterium]|nr:acyl-CoA dehydrogenase family protein [Solirubrobacterales bacterium]
MSVTERQAISFDPASLQRVLDGRYADGRDQIREVLKRPEFAPPLAIATEEYREQVLDWARTLADEQMTAPGFPEEFGGMGDPGANVVAFETLAYGDLSLLVKFGVQFGLWGGAVLQLGTREHHERYLKPTATLELCGCFAMTEADHGSNVQGLETTATYDARAGEFVINTPSDGARKEYIGNAARDGDVAAVFAQLIVGGECHGVHVLVVPIRDGKGKLCPGVRIEDCGEKMGLNGVDNGRLWFDDVRVPRDALLNRYGEVRPDGTYYSSIENPNRRFFTTIGALVQGRVCISAASISASKSGLTIAVRHGLRRRQFGPPEGEEIPILDYRPHQRRLMPLLAKSYALHFAQQELTEKFHTVFSASEPPERDRRQLETLAAGLKATSSWHATETIQICREACGGAGYMSANRIAGLKADTDIFTTFEGDNTVLMMLVAKAVLTDFKDHFAELDPRETVTFVAGQAVETVLERSFARKIGQVIADVVPSSDDTGDLLDRESQLDVFRWREGHITASVARRFKRGLDEDHDPFEVFRAVQNHAVDAARAHVDRVILESFCRAIDNCEDESLSGALSAVCDLYALWVIETERGFFQEHGRLTGPRCKAITREVNRLCNEVRGFAGELVDAFGISDEVLRAPIGLREG